MIPPLVKGPSLQFPDQEITWAGECPWTGGFCFGTESGELLICRNDGQDALDVLPIKVSEEAVNGVAFWRNYVGVSTRSQVTVARRSSSEDDLIRLITTPDGAHGILATPGGRFFAPMGTLGLLRVDLERIDSNAPTLDEPSQAVMNFYKLVYLGDPSQVEVFACAARTSGLLVIRSDRDKPLEITGRVSENVDFIDTCSVPSPKWPHAVVGLSLDRSLVFVRDLLGKEMPQSLHLGELQGTPYSILCLDRHLVVLTSKELVVFPDLLNWYLQGQSSDRPFRYRYTPIQAVEAYLAYSRYLMVVMDEEVRFFEIPRLGQPMNDYALENGHDDLPGMGEAEPLPNTVQPIWDSLSVCG